MRVTKIDEHIHLIDLEPAGIRSFVASYVLKGRKAAIIEAGPASTSHSLLAGLKKLNVKPSEVVYVAVTHIHLDHGGAAGTLLKHLPNAKVVVHQRGSSHVANPKDLWAKSTEALGKLAQIYGRPEPVPKERIVAATEGVTFGIGDNVEVKAIETLGHASHHLAYYDTVSRGVFAGDAAGIYLDEFDAVVPTTPQPYRLDIALASLKKLMSLESDALFYSHFGKACDYKKKIQGYIEQLELWKECAQQGIEKGESLDSISKRIVERDVILQRVEEHVKSHPLLSSTVLSQSVEGIIEFVRRNQDACIHKSTVK